MLLVLLESSQWWARFNEGDLEKKKEKKKKKKRLKVWEILNFEYFFVIKNSIKLPPKKRFWKEKNSVG